MASRFVRALREGLIALGEAFCIHRPATADEMREITFEDIVRREWPHHDDPVVKSYYRTCFEELDRNTGNDRPPVGR